jgi:hypothetical protein
MRVVVILLFVFALIGCGAKSKLVGTWTGQSGSMTNEVTYKADGTLNGRAVLPMPQAQGATVVLTTDGKYRLEGDDLYVTVTKADIQNLPPELESMKAQLNTEMKIGQEQKSKLVWKGEDTHTSQDSLGGPQVTFTRKK